MKDPFVWFWTAMIFLSIAWYAVLLFYVGVRGGGEILRMMRALSERLENDDAQPLAQDDQP